jgi:hypothetical protein
VIYVISTLIVVILVQTWLLWRLVGMMGLLRHYDERLSRTAQGLSLLVDTTESGFAMLSNELSKVGTAPAAKAAPRPSTRRIVTAAKKGRPVAEIAALEGLSEGEVRLRMHLADMAPVDPQPRAGESRGSVRS